MTPECSLQDHLLQHKYMYKCTCHDKILYYCTHIGNLLPNETPLCQACLKQNNTKLHFSTNVSLDNQIVSEIAMKN